MHATRTRAYAVPCTRTLLGIKQAREWQGNKSCKNVLTFSLRRGTAGNRTWQRRLERMTEGDLARCHRDNTKIRHFGSVRVTSCKFKLGVGPEITLIMEIKLTCLDSEGISHSYIYTSQRGHGGTLLLATTYQVLSWMRSRHVNSG